MSDSRFLFFNQSTTKGTVFETLEKINDERCHGTLIIERAEKEGEGTLVSVNVNDKDGEPSFAFTFSNNRKIEMYNTEIYSGAFIADLIRNELALRLGGVIWDEATGRNKSIKADPAFPQDFGSYLVRASKKASPESLEPIFEDYKEFVPPELLGDSPVTIAQRGLSR